MVLQGQLADLACVTACAVDQLAQKKFSHCFPAIFTFYSGSVPIAIAFQSRPAALATPPLIGKRDVYQYTLPTFTTSGIVALPFVRSKFANESLPLPRYFGHR